MSTVKTIGFVVHCEAPENRVQITGDNADAIPIPFNVTRQEDGPARIEARIIPLEGPASELSGQPLPPQAWGHWLSLDGDAEQSFDDAGFRNYTVRVQLPQQGMAPLGEYHFVLRVLGVDDPDERFDESDVVTIVVVGVEPGPTAYVAILAIVLAIVAAAIVGAVILFSRRATLDVKLDAPVTVEIGQTLPYTLTVHNTRSTTITNVLMQYTLPSGLLGATANVPGALYRRCDQAGGDIWCDLGSLGAQQQATVTLRAIPGPSMASSITNTHIATVTADGYRLPSPAVPTVGETEVMTRGEGVSVVISPSVGLATLGEPMTLQILAWDNAIAPTGAISPTELGAAVSPPSYTVLYALPQGLRYHGDKSLPDGCQHRSYFQIECQVGSLDNTRGIRPRTISLDLLPTLATSNPPLHTAGVIDGAGRLVVTDTLAVPVKETSLFFDGIDDYAELGYAGVPESFTIEMWVHPYSTDDGQNFIGLHEPTGANLFLLGYYEDGLHVNLHGTRVTVKGVQDAAPHHIAVSVQRNDQNPPGSQVAIYIDDEPQRFAFCSTEEDGLAQVAIYPQEPPVLCPDGRPPRDADEPIEVNQALDPKWVALNWVLGQDWDRDPSGQRVTSDFFYGRISDVRLWNGARLPDKNRRLTANDIKTDPQLTQLIGYWPLVPDPDASSPLLIERVSRVRPDDSRAKDGERKGASWQISDPRLATALQFDGVDDVATSDLVLPTHDLEGGQPYAVTFAAWLYVDSVPSEAQWIVGQAAQPALLGAALAGLVVDRSGHVAVVAWYDAEGGGRWMELPDRKPIPTGRWVHYTGIVTYTADAPPQLKLYRNGADVKTDLLGKPRVDFQPEACAAGVHVGGLCQEASRHFFKGRVDEIRIWERALGAAEVPRWLLRPGESFDEIAYWPLDDGPGLQVAEGGCKLEQSCNWRLFTPGYHGEIIDDYHLDLSEPAWVQANFHLADLGSDSAASLTGAPGLALPPAPGPSSRGQ